MGKVFTWAQIINSDVPKLTAFNEVVKEAHRLFANSPSVYGALLCGSVLNGSHTIRSDLDCVLGYAQADEVPAINCMRQLVAFARERHVPIEPILLNLDQAKAGIHNFGHSFMMHLQRAAERGGVIKANPIAYICMGKQPPLSTDIFAYLTRKAMTFAKQLALMPQSEQEQAHFYEKILGVAPHVCRKMLLLWNKDATVEGAKTGIIQAYLEHAPSNTHVIVQKLMSFDDGYTSEVSHHLAQPSRTRYRHHLRLIETVAAHQALEFLRLNASLIA